MINTYPANFARFYDTIYHQMRDTVDSEYFQNKIKTTKGKILEVGTGTGRLFLNALHNGADMYGLDISESMLGILYKKLDRNQHFRISQQNITDFSYDFKFDLIIAPFRVFMHLLEKEDHIIALNNVWDHLNSKGRFIFDAFIPDLKQLIHRAENQIDFEGEYAAGHKVKRFISTNPDLIKQIIEVNFHLEWDEGRETKHDDWRVPLRYFFRYELEHLIERSKFESYKICGDYKDGILTNQSKDFIVTCQKG
jgi:SAM-dependent methyltransferase